MRLLAHLLGLPSSLLLLLVAQSELNESGAFAQRLPTAIRKMGLDEGEKFLHEYCAFGDDDTVGQAIFQPRAPIPASAILSPDEERLLEVNASAAIPYRPPFAPHFESGLYGEQGLLGWDLFRRAASALARLERRQFACPTGTSDCSAIGYPYSCCQTGLTCVEIEDTGLGPVGCCPSGSSCGGSIACSGSQVGCPSNMGGGCCIDGFVCEGVGCVRSQTTGTLVTLTSTATTVLNSGSPTTVVVTVTITQTPSQSTATRTTTQVVTPSETSTSSTTSGPGAPVRPTLTSSTTDEPSSSTTQAPGYCPTGYYACLASAGGGCCQTGRDCSTTSCPPVSSTTIISSGVTVVVPATDIPATTSASCASGWFLCGSDAGPVAGCCPSGYDCGTASCTLMTASATATVQKERPGTSGGSMEGGWTMMTLMIPALAFALGFAMI